MSNMEETKTELEEEIKYNRQDVMPILGKLGFPLDNCGTGLYADIIIRILELRTGRKIRTDKEKTIIIEPVSMEKIEETLTNPFNSIYQQVAREDHSIGVKRLRDSIEAAVKNIDDSKIDAELAFEIVGNTAKEYDEIAVKVAEYVKTKKSTKEKSTEENKVKTIGEMKK